MQTAPPPLGDDAGNSEFRIRVLPAAEASAVDLATDDCTNGAAKDRSERAVAATGKFMARKRTYTSTDYEAGGAIVTLAIVTTVAAPPHVAIAGDTAWLHVIAAVIIDAMMVGPILGALAMGRGPGRRIGRRRCCGADSGQS